MPKNLLLEAGFLCLPDNLFAAGMPDCKEALGNVLRRERIDFSRLRCWISQHRIGILIEGLSESQSEIVKEIRGPKASSAYDFNNLPSPAAKGFASAQGLEFKDLVTREIDGEKFLFAIKSTPGQSIEKFLPVLIERLFAGFPFAVAPWHQQSLFPQPPVYFAAMLDCVVPDLDLEGVKASPRIGFREGLALKFHELASAGDYPQIMTQIGLIGEFAERRKTFEARIRSILPEGYLPRADSVRSGKICFYSEGMQPMLLKFDPQYLEIPEAALHRYLLINNGYLACEDARGRILPAAVAVTEQLKPSSSEIALRTAALEAQLKKLLAKWNRDKESLPAQIAIIAKKFAAGNTCIFELSDSLARCAIWLAAKLLPEKDSLLVSTILALIAEGEKTELASLIPGTGFAVVINCLGEDVALQPLRKYFDEICNYFAHRIPAPQTSVAQIVCLAILIRSHAEPYSGVQAPISRIVGLLRAASIKIDVFQFFADVYPDFSLDRRSWTESCSTDALFEQQIALLSESFMLGFEFDPVSFYDAARDWKELTAKEAESLSALYLRIRAKIDNCCQIDAEASECKISTELAAPLAQIEASAGINYGLILEFFSQQKVNIEACLINLPPVLDENNPEQKPKIALLQRIIRQLGRLPFINREKSAGRK